MNPHTRNSEELASDLVFALATRIAVNPAPTWPVPIFEAEAELYPDFIRNLLSALDGMKQAGADDREIAKYLESPTRIVELSYFLLGATQSGLEISDRRRLAGTLATTLAFARPIDTFCERGVNLLLDHAEVDSLAGAIADSARTNQIPSLARLRGALLSLMEILHVGIPQYGREVHGPYAVSPDLFMIVRDYFDFQMPEVLPSTADFPVKRIRISEVYSGTPAMVQFDISNHLTTRVRLQELLERFAIHVVETNGTGHRESVDILAETVLAELTRLLNITAEYTRWEWFRQHRRARYHYLTPLLQQSGRHLRKTYESSLSSPQPGIHREVEQWNDIPALELYERLCAELGLPPKRRLNGKRQ